MKQKILFLCSLFMCAISVFGQTLDQTGNGSFSTDLLVFGNNDGQSFRAGITGNLASITFNVNNTPSPTLPGNFTVSIYDGDGYGGSLLGSANLNVNSATGGSVVVNFPSTISLIAGNTYTFGLQSSDGARINLFTNNNGYLNGSAYSNGVSLATRDLYFSTFMFPQATHLNFDGANDFVDLGSSLTSTLNGSNFFTAEAWVYTPSVTGTKTIVGNHISNGAHFNLRIINDRLNGFLGFGAYDLNSAAGTIVANTWQHVAMVYNDTTLKLYIDGTEVASMAIPAAYSLQNTVQPYRIGASGYGGEYFNGNIDDVRIWNVVKTPDQLAASKNCELLGNEPGLLRYYKLNQGIDTADNSAITSATDATANANNGTLNGFTLNGSTSNWLAGSPVTTGSIVPSVASVTTPVVYAQGATASALTATAGANGTGLMWYTTATGGTGSPTAPTPSTATVGNTSFWVSSTNANGCESTRTEIVVNVLLPATHLNFDGSNDFVNIGSSIATALNGATALTLEAWINPSALNGWNNIITDYDGAYHKFLLRVRNNNNIQFWLNGTVLNSSFTVPLNTWTHIAAVYDGTNMFVYANGVLVGSQAATVSLPATANQVNIGSRIGSNTENFTGNIEDVRVWSSARTPEQINGSMNCELAGNESGLIAYYNFNQGIDQSDNSTVTTLNAVTGPNGTLTNFTLTGTTSNWLAGSPVTTGSIVPSAPTVTTPVVYNQGDTASALTATVGVNGTGLVWYTTATGGTGDTTAPTPSTASAGNTSYWVASTNANGCESARVEIVVTVIANATHLNFDGVNDFIVSANAITNNTENQTYQAWFRIPSIPANSDRILQRGNDGTGGWSLQIDVNAAGRLSAGISATPDTFMTGTTVLTPNTWYHATFVFENNNSLRLYLNGNLEASVAIGNRTLRNSDNRLRIGVGNIASEYFNGDIDEVRVWNIALSQTDIMNTMNCEAQTQPELVAYYKFNQGNDSVNNSTVTSLLDSSSNGNNGTLTNFTLTGTTSNWRSGSTITTGNTCVTLGSSDFENSANSTIYPNPSNGIFNIVSQQNVSIEIYDLLGKLVLNQHVIIGTNNVDISNFNNGVYLLKVTDGNGNSQSHKIIKN
ncbi:T9SS type A sorting domain-containing protein [Flavobacterium sp. LMO8]|uniref:T9SS type A sorting domain-containing protein n=1 Tax=Flavobacterium sp. LMO8 TaxID=2654244 RepID=UPI001291DF22|nr:LamG-like jellyroll fold domain-containing protein [Flavobacterium sp. LMO8]MQP25286.1 T9SS type A sorting domain-containing protein [Flavobacterium sp. LMO8]